MRFLKVFSVVVVVSLLTSCTIALLHEMEGGHSPMMKLNGIWNIEDNYVIDAAGNRTDPPGVGVVWFNSTVDQGDYCQGTWMDEPVEDDRDFLWGVNEIGDVFTMKGADDQDELWTVVDLSKDHFEIERTEENRTFHMEFLR